MDQIAWFEKENLEELKNQGHTTIRTESGDFVDIDTTSEVKEELGLKE